MASTPKERRTEQDRISGGFALSVGGVSHTEDEFTECEGVVTATNGLFNAVLANANEPAGVER